MESSCENCGALMTEDGKCTCMPEVCKMCCTCAYDCVCGCRKEVESY
ncbi:MAG: hypothetical protein WCO55_00905 [Candidatus Falkowbacteria bacterium]